MAVYSKKILSVGTDGRGIKIANTSTNVHVAVSGTSSFDEVWMWCTNSDTVDVLLTVEWGGTTDPDDLMEVSIPPQEGWFLVSPGLILQNGKTISCKGGTTNVLTINGYVNAIV